MPVPKAVYRANFGQRLIGKDCQHSLSAKALGAERESSHQRDVAELVQKARKKGHISTGQQHKEPKKQQSWHKAKRKLNDNDLLTFERKGHLVTKALIAREDLHNLAKEVRLKVHERKLQALRHRVRVLCPDSDLSRLTSVEEAKDELHAHGTEPVGFLQFFNLWRTRTAVWSTAKRLAGVAAELMGCNQLRLYQDCAFLKEPGYAETNWHSDLRMTPLDTNDFVTAWIPLRSLQASHDSGLIFASGSHRDFALPFWHHSALEDMDLGARGYPISRLGAMDLGDVSWHSGWTLHKAPVQPKGTSSRLALSISYFKDGTRLLPQKAAALVQMEDQESFQDWHMDLKHGAVARHKLLPELLRSNQ